MTTTKNEIAIARKAIKTAIAKGEICKEISGCHRVGIQAIRNLCKNDAIAWALAEHAARDVILGR